MQLLFFINKLKTATIKKYVMSKERSEGFIGFSSSISHQFHIIYLQKCFRRIFLQFISLPFNFHSSFFNDAHFTLLRYCRGFTAHLNLVILMHCAGLRTDFFFFLFRFVLQFQKSDISHGETVWFVVFFHLGALRETTNE